VITLGTLALTFLVYRKFVGDSGDSGASAMAAMEV
jgi:hypothetical protein